MPLSAQQIQDKYANRAANARDSWEEGVRQVDRSPGEAAAQKGDLWLARLQESRERWERNVGSVSLEEWRSRSLAVGGTRYQQGVRAGADKYGEYMRDALPRIRQFQDEVNSMPDATFEDNIQRMVRNAELMRSLKR